MQKTNIFDGSQNEIIFSQKVVGAISLDNLYKSLSRHPSVGSIASGTATVSESGDELDDSDYGLYEDFEDVPSASRMPAVVQASSDLLRYNAHTRPSKINDPLRKVVYTVKNSHSHISCRSFDKSVEKSFSQLPVCISVTGVRIVQDSMGMHAEFFVKMSLGHEDYVGWKTSDDFKQVANACLAFSVRKRTFKWRSLFLSKSKKEIKFRVSRSTRLKKTLDAWDNVMLVNSKRNWFGPLSVCSLMNESNALEKFLECLLFEIPDVDILLEFISSN